MFQRFLYLLTTLVGLLGLIVNAFPSALAQQSCPPADALAPCTCDERHVGILCYNEADDPNFDLQAVFDRITPLVDENTVFPLAVIGNLPSSYRQLPANLTSLKFLEIQIGFCPSLEYIHPEAFNGSYESTLAILVTNNRLSNRNNHSDNFEFFGKFPKLRSLVVEEEGHLEYIPDGPWPLRLNSLQWLTLDLCGLVGVGSRFLENLPNLMYPSIYYCNMSLDGFAPDAFHGLGQYLELDLQHNPIDYLPETLFKPALDSAFKVIVGGLRCPPSSPGCYNQRLRCDEEAAWLCKNQTVYQPKLEGFWCEGAEEDYDVWDWCRDNNNNIVTK